MGWAVGYDMNWNRWIGYGVPAFCDHPGCAEEIDRGLGYVCGGEPKGGERGCGLYFCGSHLSAGSLCQQCRNNRAPFIKKPEHPKWLRHKLTDASWQQWRDEHPHEVVRIREALAAVDRSGEGATG